MTRKEFLDARAKLDYANYIDTVGVAVCPPRTVYLAPLATVRCQKRSGRTTSNINATLAAHALRTKHNFKQKIAQPSQYVARFKRLELKRKKKK